uniref:Uncharacterized protein n=1 Tax=Vespula pensylvanica TaxID=30213 RepID=A0A834PF23_VESPE|nr:hypothetical protein H0235_000930 [Vespula pensylvanica]
MERAENQGWSPLSVDVETHDVIEKQNTTLNDDNKLKGKKKIAKLTVGLGIQRRGGGGMGSGAARYGGGEYLPEGKQPGASSALFGADWPAKSALRMNSSREGVGVGEGCSSKGWFTPGGSSGGMKTTG